MSEPTQSRPIPVGVLVSVSDARARARPKPARIPPPRRATDPRRSWQRRVALVQDVPWYAFAAVAIALWSIAFAGFACFAKMPDPLIVQAPLEPAHFAPAPAVLAPAEAPAEVQVAMAPVEEIQPMAMPEPAPAPIAEPVLPPPQEPAQAVVVAAAPERKPEPAIEAPAAPSKPAVCPANIGTQITFVKDPPEAFKRAREENKLVFLIHLSGNFEDKEFT
jgi:hypothetical protein